MTGQATASQPFVAHLVELRRRIFWSVASMAIGGVVGYFLHDVILELIVSPLNQPLYYTSPTGGFDFMLKVCLFFGFIVSVPVFTYNLLKFLEPTIPRKSKSLITKLLLTSTVLSACGVSFAYLVSLPAALHFLMEFGSHQVQALISTSEYFSFAMVYLAGFAVLFQLPLILLFINRITPLPPRKLMKQQRTVVLVSFIAAALITPTPDPLNQTLMAVPIVVLYQISVIIIWFKNRGQKFAQPAELSFVEDPLLKPAQLLPVPKPVFQKPQITALPSSSLMPVMKPQLATSSARTAIKPAPRFSQPAVSSRPNIDPLQTLPPKKIQKPVHPKPNFPRRVPLVDLTKIQPKSFNAVPRYNILNLKQ